MLRQRAFFWGLMLAVSATACGGSGTVTYGNLSVGKFYTFSEAPSSSYPDRWPCLYYSDGAKLTDEELGVSWPMDQWVGWNSKPSVEIVLDLGRVYDIDTVKLQTASRTGWSIYYPQSLDIMVRTDAAQDWQPFGQATPPADTEDFSHTWLTVTAGKTPARYVKYTLAGSGSGFLFAAEIEVWGDIVNIWKHAPDVGFYNGAFPVTHQGWLDVARHETITGQPLSMVLWYHQLNPAYSGSTFSSIASLYRPGRSLGSNIAGYRYLTIGWLPSYSTAEEIASGAGDYDGYLQQWFTDAIDPTLRRGNTDPIWIRPMNEMNGAWTFPGNSSTPSHMYGGDPLNFRRAWRRLYNIAEQVGAVDAHVFLWAPNGISYPSAEWNLPDQYYPGDQYVDWVGISVYAQSDVPYPTAIINGTAGTGSFNFADNWTYKPLMVAEGCWRRTSSHDGERWINEWFDMIHNFPRMKAAVWFHFQKDPANPDDLGNSDMALYEPELLDLFRQRLAEHYYLKDKRAGWVDHNRDGAVDVLDVAALGDHWLEDRRSLACFLEAEVNDLFAMEAQNADRITPGSGEFTGIFWQPVDVSAPASVSGTMMQLAGAEGVCAAEAQVADAPRLRFNLWFDRPGQYYVHLRAGGTPQVSTGLYLGLNGALHFSYTYTPTNPNNRWYDTALALNVTQAGLNTVDVWMQCDAAKLDRVMLTTVPSLYLTAEPAQSRRVSMPIVPVDTNGDGVVDFNDFAQLGALYSPQE